MRKSRHIEVRKILIDNPDGMTAKELSDLMGIELTVTVRALKAMPDVYIDRWVKRPGVRNTAVWCRGDIPENCPKPTKENHDQEHHTRRLLGPEDPLRTTLDRHAQCDADAQSRRSP